MPSLASIVDGGLGDLVEAAVCRHHRRRLARVGWATALESGPGWWARNSPPPRAGSAVEVLVDGAEALPAMAEAIGRARSHVHIAGWHMEGAFRLRRSGPAQDLASLLALAGGGLPVRVLVWAGAPLLLFSPSRRRVRADVGHLRRRSGVEIAVDAHERPMHCHHEKLVIVDDEVAFVGGIDLTALAGDRYDIPGHPQRRGTGWHDAAAELRGPVVADVAAHFRQRWHAVTGTLLETGPVPGRAGDVSAQIVRTVPEHVYDQVPDGDFTLLEAYVRAFRSAQRLISIENQFLWSPEIVAILAAKLRNPPSADFRIVAILPQRPNNGGDDTRGQLAVLADADADGGGGRLLAATIYAGGSGEAPPAPVYVHAKVAIVDDRWLTVGSANLNEHSLFNDTEVNVVVDDADLARRTRLRLWAEHLDLDPDDVAGDGCRVVDEMLIPAADAARSALDAGRRLPGRLVRLHPRSRRAGRLLGPLDGLLVDG